MPITTTDGGRSLRHAREPMQTRSQHRPRRGWRAALKDLIFLAYLYCGYVQVRDLLLRMIGRSRVVVLCYHRVGGCDVLSKPTAEFRRDVQYLKRHYECMSLAELHKRLQADEPIRRPIAVVTFDDGYRDNFTEAVPVLREEGVAATFFVATGFIGTHREFPHDLQDRTPGEARDGHPCAYPKLTWDELRIMESAGFEIGSHTVNHANLGGADEQTVGREMRDSLVALGRMLGIRPRAFSFPWGKPDDISDSAIRMARRLGYYAAVSAYGGYNRRGTDPLRIRRVDAGNGMLSRAAFRARVAGLDPDYLRRKFILESL